MVLSYEAVRPALKARTIDSQGKLMDYRHNAQVAPQQAMFSLRNPRLSRQQRAG